MARSSVPPSGAEHFNEVASSLKLADKLVREGKFSAALEKIVSARARDPQNPYAIAYEERIKSLLASTRSINPLPEFVPAPRILDADSVPDPWRGIRTVDKRATPSPPESSMGVQRAGDPPPATEKSDEAPASDPKIAAFLTRAHRYEREQEFERAYAELARASLRDPENPQILHAQLRLLRVLEARRAVIEEDQAKREEAERKRQQEFIHAQADPAVRTGDVPRTAQEQGLRGRPSAPPAEKNGEQRRQEEDALHEVEAIRLRRENRERRAHLEEVRREAEAERQRLEEEEQRLRAGEAQRRAEIEFLKKADEKQRLLDEAELRRVAAERLAREAEAKTRQEEEARRAEAERLEREDEERRRQLEEALRRETGARLAREIRERRAKEDELRKTEADRIRNEEEKRRLREEEAERQEQIARLKRELEEKRLREEEERREDLRQQIEESLERARRHLAARRLEEALTALSFGTAADPSNAEVRDLTAQIRKEQDQARVGNRETGRPEVPPDEGPAEETTRAIHALIDEADTLSAQQHFKDALRTIARAYALDPESPAVRSCEMRVVAAMQDLRREHEEAQKQKEREIERKKEEEFRQLVESQRQRTLREMSDNGGTEKKKGRNRSLTRPYRSPGSGS